MQKQRINLLKTKQHFEILDWIKRDCRFGCGGFHFMEVAYTDYSQNFINHGFLAVDFFIVYPDS